MYRSPRKPAHRPAARLHTNGPQSKPVAKIKSAGCTTKNRCVSGAIHSSMNGAETHQATPAMTPHDITLPQRAPIALRLRDILDPI